LGWPALGSIGIEWTRVSIRSGPTNRDSYDEPCPTLLCMATRTS
jgi:hypothetical protein